MGVFGSFCLARLFPQVVEGIWLRGKDLNLRPLGYEPNELPDCSTPHPHPSTCDRGVMRRRAPLLPRRAGKVRGVVHVAGTFVVRLGWIRAQRPAHGNSA